MHRIEKVLSLKGSKPQKLLLPNQIPIQKYIRQKIFKYPESNFCWLNLPKPFFNLQHKFRTRYSIPKFLIATRKPVITAI